MEGGQRSGDGFFWRFLTRSASRASGADDAFFIVAIQDEMAMRLTSSRGTSTVTEQPFVLEFAKAEGPREHREVQCCNQEDPNLPGGRHLSIVPV